MRNKTVKKTDEFRQFKTNIFFRTILLLFISVVGISFLYNFIFRGRFANGVVYIFQNLLGMERETALDLYQHTFRNHIDWVFFLALVLVFAVVFRIYLNWFAKYFMEINKGIDTLIEEGAGDVFLSPEMSVTEKKINTIKHTLEKRKMDAMLSEQRKNDMIVYLAHDLKTPLASVIGYLTLLSDAREISDELREKYISITLNKAERLEDLINEFFEIARFNLSNITLQYGRINMTRLLEMLIFEFGPMLKEKNLECSLHVSGDIMVKCDGDKIQRVFDNLLRNAVIYSYEGTVIDIFAAEEDKNVMIQFTNHGNTIPADKLEQIFSQFYRLDVSRSTERGGAGLGLAIAKQIVELHHGTVTAKSREEVTAFKVTLPKL